MAQHVDAPSGGWRDERFRAEPGPMRRYGRKFQDLGDGAEEAMTYAATYVDFDPSGCAAIERLAQGMIGVDSGIQDLLKDIYAAVHGSGVEISRSADRYEALDSRAAAALDRSYWQH